MVPTAPLIFPTSRRPLTPSNLSRCLDVSLAQTPVIPREELPPDMPGDRPDREEDLVAIKKKVVRLRPNSLLCSLEHDIILLDLDELMPEDEDER